jgi:type I restriction enzyme S subunit
VRKGDLIVVYASGGTKGIVGAFEVEKVLATAPALIWKNYRSATGLSRSEFDDYFAESTIGYAIEVGKHWRLTKPVRLKTLRKRRTGFRPPQSYHYWDVDELLAFGGGHFARRVAQGRRGV